MHERRIPEGLVPSGVFSYMLEKVRLNAAYGKVEMSERLKSTFAYSKWK